MKFSLSIGSPVPAELQAVRLEYTLTRVWCGNKLVNLSAITLERLHDQKPRLPSRSRISGLTEKPPRWMKPPPMPVLEWSGSF